MQTKANYSQITIIDPIQNTVYLKCYKLLQNLINFTNFYFKIVLLIIFEIYSIIIQFLNKFQTLTISQNTDLLFIQNVKRGSKKIKNFLYFIKMFPKMFQALLKCT